MTSLKVDLSKLSQKLIEMLVRETFEKMGWKSFCVHTAQVEPCSHDPLDVIWEVHESVVGTVSYRGKVIFYGMCFDDCLTVMRFETHPDKVKVDEVLRGESK